ncbi:two-component system chemotaxis sensor kinase CheA [Hypnocyclicus thermotrophus]|uniref:histidine kinase n=1 Tax=Hypnocyclicus thermotrophus TaxID=1627895 RepID=A0AA46I589_9FUSO|nr:ATP-binding protein [Hypnocyclicus thermotrophus]TDT69196.1 two-component system chemotaxis sensor kinase CheA [Hypnocyclicus thermotrophus]
MKLDNLFKKEFDIIENNKKFLEDFFKNNNNISKEEISNSYNQLLKDYQKLLKQTLKLTALGDKFQKISLISEKEVQLLLDNSKQGFLFIDKNFIIQKKISKESLRIFNKNSITGLNILDLLSFKSEHAKETYINTLNSLFTSHPIKKRVYLSLLENNFIINKKHITIDYELTKILSDNTEVELLVFILTDITEQIKFRRRIQNEKRTILMLTSAISNSIELKNNINDYINFYHQILPEIISSYSFEESCSKIFIEIHNFKALFSQFYMFNTVKKLHHFESKLSYFMEHKLKFDIFPLIKNINHSKLFQKDKSIIEFYLGKNFFNENKYIEISEERIDLLINAVSKYCPSDNIKKEVYSLKYISLHKHFNNLKTFTYNSCKSNHKFISSFKIEGNDIMLSPKYYKNFLKTLIHLFRNIAEHAIESPEKRDLLKKTKGGNINIKTIKNKNLFSIIITDDGKGIDKKMLLKKLNSLSNGEFLKKKYSKNILEVIFEPSFSTNRTINYSAGRGVGITKVKEEIIKLNGSIKVESIINKGTRFIITLPYLE